MRIKYPSGIDIELTHEEAIEIYYAVKERMISAIKSHWINYPDLFLENASTSLGILKQLSRLTNYPYENVLLPELLAMLKKGGK